MKNRIPWTFTQRSGWLLACLALTLFLFGCEDNPYTPNLYDPNLAVNPTPTLASISPSDSAQAGIDTLTLTGSNFSTVLTDNIVYLNSSVGTVLSATTTQLRISTPLVVGDSVSAVVAVMRAPKFSNPIVYKLSAAMVKFGNLAQAELAYGVTTDSAGNVYVAYTASGLEAGILKYTPSGTRSTYAPATAGTAKWNTIKMGPSGFLYAARGVRAIYRFAAGGGASATAWVSFPIGVLISDFDFDSDKNVWAVGNNANIYCVTPAKTITPYPFVGNVRSARVYNGYLYFSARTTVDTVTSEKIWRASISAGVLGTPAVYFDFGAYYPGSIATGLTFTSDGQMFIGTDNAGKIVVVDPSLANRTPYTIYTSLVSPECDVFAWGNGESLYASASNGGLVQITVRGKQSAPYYGVN